MRRRPLAVVGAALAVSALAIMALPLGYDDDVIRFLPAGDPDVEDFERIAERFGSLEVALVAVAVEPPAGDEDADLFTHGRLSYLRALTRALEDARAVPEVRDVTGFVDLSVIHRDAHVALVPDAIPREAEALAALRDRILGLDYLTGGLVSEGGGAALFVVQLRRALPGGQTISSKQAAEAVKRAAVAVPRPPELALHFGGAPFIAEAAASGTEADIARLAPFVTGALILLIALSLGSLRAAMLTLITVGLGVLWTLGLIGWLGRPLTLVSSSLPVILVALGSAYAVHVMVWYREHGGDVSSTLRHMGWPVLVTALTTAAGFLSFLVMDLAPMREFGWQMAAGAMLCAVCALVVMPALLQLVPVKPAQRGVSRTDRWLLGAATLLRERRWWVIGAGLVVGIGCATQLPGIDTRMNTQAFFAPDSAPARADQLLSERFGGSTYLLVMVDGDVRDPAVLHRLAAFEDRLQALDAVARTESIAGVLAVVHEGLEGRRRLPRTRGDITRMGYMARTTDPAVRLLVDDAWEGALIQVGIGGFDTGVVEQVAGEVRALADASLVGRAQAVAASDARRQEVFRDAAERIAARLDVPASEVDGLAEALERASGADVAAEVRAAVRAVVAAEIVEDEMVYLRDGADVDALVATLAEAQLAGALTRERTIEILRGHADPSELSDPGPFERGAGLVYTRIDQACGPLRRAALEAAVAGHVEGADAGSRLRVGAILDELVAPTWYVPVPPETPGAARVSAVVSGHPVIQQAMTRSVQRNQGLSLLVSLPLVLVIMALVFRSALAGFIGLVPAGLTLLIVFGLMGTLPRALPMDIGSSMLASIALGVGIDYAIHYLWRYQRGGLTAAVRTTGRAILINASEITLAFAILAFATIAPMSRFGILTAATLLAAAVATLTLLPALLTFWAPRRPAEAPAPATQLEAG